MQPYNSISVMTADSSGDGIEECSGLEISIMNPGELNSATRVQIQSNAIVNEKGTYFFLIIPTDPVPVGGWIKVVLPS